MTAAQVSAITTAISFTEILTGVGAVGAAIVVVLVAQRGLKMLLNAVRS